MAVDVATPVFEGPFDLLLHLILQEEVDLYEVPLHDVVDAYLGELAKMEQLDLELATEFLLIAATLVELKSKRLLPDDDSVDLDDELALWEERDLLLSRLVEAKTFKDAAGAMAALARDAGRSRPRTAGVEERFIGLLPDLLAGVEPTDLRDAFLRALTPPPVPAVDIGHIHMVRASVTDAVAELLDELPRLGSATFAHLTGGLVERLEVVVRFLAVLELFKQGWIDLDQPENFGTLTIRWIGRPDDLLDLTDVSDAADADDTALALAGVDAYDG